MPESVEVMIRTSERTCFKRCRQQWAWAYVEHLRSKRGRPALEFGDLVHRALEAYYVPGRKRKGHPAKHLVRIYRQILKDGGDEILPVNDDPSITAEDLGVEMLNNYINEFGADERYEVIASEMTFAVDIHHPVRGHYLYTYVGTVDGCWRDMQTGYLIFLENKTGAGLEPFGAPLPLDEQAGSYAAFAPFYLQSLGLLEAGECPDYILYNRLRKAFLDTRPRDDKGRSLNRPSKEALTARATELGCEILRGSKVEDLMEMVKMAGEDPMLLGEPSKIQPAPLFKRELVYRSDADRASTMNRVMEEAHEMYLVRKGKMAIYKNPDRHCGFCEFRDMCEVHETGSDWKAMRKQLYTSWAPYDAHEVQTERRH